MSRFFDLPGSHKPPNAAESDLIPIQGRRASLTYFDYGATERAPKISSKLDPENPNKDKLGTFEGVFVPTTLNVLSILMFLRFGFIIGQMGVLGTIILLILSYGINLLTTLSISAISTNGTVRGGGAYYMISRSLGPEFGGSIGLIFFLGQMLNSGMNVLGVIEPVMYNFGSKIDQETPAIYPLLNRGYWWEFLYASLILLFCLGIALVGSATVSKAGKVLFWLLLFSTLSIPISALFVSPFNDGEIIYTGPSLQTLKENLYPHFTKKAAGSLLKGKETFNDLFGIFFPATAGIFAGAGMSSELRKPSRSIPKGTLWGLMVTFFCYLIVIFTIGLCVPRESLHRDVQIIQTISASQVVILIGELSTSIFSIVVGIVGAAFVLEAIAKDCIFPGISIFEKHPVWSILFTWLLTQLCLFSDVNQIATFITMTFLTTFVVMNLACFLLEISSAPNFRPSFKYFDWYTACIGGALAILAMLIVDAVSAFLVILVISVIFVVIHLFSAPKPWGDVSQNIIYHQVRKYLLRLRQDNVKYWRPQILLLVDNPRTSWSLIKFCNNLKKGGLYVLGHVTVGESFQSEYEEMRKQTRAWVKIRDMANIKAFVQVGTGPSLPWGVRNVFLGSGLGGMKPNITVIGFFDLENYYKNKGRPEVTSIKKRHAKTLSGLPASRQKNGSVAVEIPDDLGLLPTDVCKNEKKIKAQQWVQIIEDLSLMHSNIAVARMFKDLNLPNKHDKCEKKKYIDLYPIQMSAKVEVEDDSSEGVTATNFDTYTLILQLGTILVTVPSWKRTHCLRVVVFIENEFEKHDENKRISNLLNLLRIEAEIVVVSLDQFRVYNTIIKGDPIKMEHVNKVLKDDPWWIELTEARGSHKTKRRFSTIATPSNDQRRGLGKNVPRYDVSQLQRLGVSMSMKSSFLKDDFRFPDGSEDDEPDLDPDSDATEEPFRTIRGKEIDRMRQTLSAFSAEVQKNTSRSKPLKVSDERSVRSLMPVFSSDALPKTKVIEDASGDEPSLIPVVENSSVNSSVLESGRKKMLPPLSPCQSTESVLADLRSLTFNDVPSRGQHLILNDVMTQVSRKSDLIFSTLPLPPLNTHKSEEGSLEYIENLNVWLAGLPPTMLMNSKSTTVTTAL
ncbi:LAME_0C07844g1_1 [Lachancea meyersii CBS 8951]|uniref:LAME_0C07844g1_1 n=1 Tax=Lachancea meyersii CBS 8951 TaxID=1266667 RepID=A0A1G4J2S9_9SACH|nr:LAME_0C07844g1_1 [Lachancea meyersii CBS 8951]